jgi:hypothetical protein
MVTGAHLGKELAVTVKNEIGVLADMSRILADHGVNIEAVKGYAEGDEATIILMTDDNLRAKEALQKERYKSIEESEVVIVDLENKPGALKNITNRLAGEGVDIKHIYGTICPKGCPARLIMSTSDNEKALLAFKK